MKKKILLVIDKIATGGAEKILIDYQNYLQKKNYDVSLFALYGEKETSNIKYGIKHNSSNIIIKIIQQIYLLIKIQTWVTKNNPDCIFSFLERSNVLVQALPFYKKNKILSVHNLLSIQYKKIHNKFIRKYTIRIISHFYNMNRTKIIAVSSQVKNDLIENLNVKEQNIQIINNCVDKKTIIEKSLEVITEFKIEPDCIYILNIGRFTLQKAQNKLIKAFYYLQKNYNNKNLRLILIGEGELKNNILELIQEYNIESFVHIVPPTSNPYKFMKLASLLILPSLYEGFPIVLSEAIALGLPTIGSRNAIPREIFTTETDWNKYIYNNTIYNTNYSTEIEEDDITLSELIKKALSETTFQAKWNEDVKIWNLNNSKEYQFECYLKLTNENKH